MPIRIDFSNVKAFEPLPSGVYDVVVVEVEERDGPKAPYLNWTLEVQGGEYANRKVWTITSLSEDAAWKMAEALIAFGVDEEAIKSLNFEFEPEDYIGVECRAAVFQEDYNGRMVNKVSKLLPYELSETETNTETKGTTTGTTRTATTRPRSRPRIR